MKPEIKSCIKIFSLKTKWHQQKTRQEEQVKKSIEENNNLKDFQCHLALHPGTQLSPQHQCNPAEPTKHLIPQNHQDYEIRHWHWAIVAQWQCDDSVMMAKLHTSRTQALVGFSPCVSWVSWEDLDGLVLPMQSPATATDIPLCQRNRWYREIQPHSI